MFVNVHCISCFAQVIKKIVVVGNVSIERDVILNEIPYKEGQEYSQNVANDILKALIKTKYFDDVSVSIQDDIITIHVIENPIINKIVYEGMKHKIKDILDEIIKLKPRQVLSKHVIQETQQTILEIYRHQGCLNASVTPKIVKLPNNRVNLVFEVKDGAPTYVKKIIFTGNKSFSSSTLKEMLSIKEKSWFHLAFLGGTKNKVYEQEKFIEDQKELIRFYLSQGYADFEIISANAELSHDKQDFFLTYYIKEGDVYKFGDLTVESKITQLKSQNLQSCILAKKGSIFNGEMIDFCKDIIKSLAKFSGVNFVVVEPVFTKDEKNKVVHIKFVVEDGPKIFIEKINIIGNNHTRDFVIRRELGFKEGDAYDQKLLQCAEERVKRTEFFKRVRVEPSEGSDKEKAIITVDVDEEQTGEVFARAGYSSIDKALIELRVYRPNFRGTGQQLEFQLSYAKRILDGSIELSEPYLFGRRLLGNVELFHSRSKRTRGFIQSRTGIAPGIGYNLSPHVLQYWTYKIYRENLVEDIDKNAQEAARKIENVTNKSAYETWLNSAEGKAHTQIVAADEFGVSWGSAIIHTIAYDCRDRRFLPTKGYRAALTTKYSGLGGSIKHLINTLACSWHHKLYRDVTLTVRGAFAHATGIGDEKIRIVDALYLGGESLRGFDFGGISPHRGVSKVRVNKLVDQFIANSANFNYITPELRNFLVTKQDMIKRAFTLEQHDLNIGEIMLLSQLITTARQRNQPEVMQLVELQSIRARRLGATLSWNGSVELSCPVPGISRDADIYMTVFFDAGSAWRSNRKDGNDETSVIADEHILRAASGFSFAWKSPFGLISIGYAWPLKKHSLDTLQRFLFGYGMKFS